LLSQVQREVARQREEAEKESMRLRGEAEREAHRTLGTGRREAEEALRTARMEAEKLVLDARASHDEIIETANRKAEVAQERTRALEQRRDELRRELDSVRAAIAAVESELDERREALGLTASEPEPGSASADPLEQWVPGETVRVVRPGHPDAGTDELPVVSEPRPRPDPTPELRVLSPDELRSRQERSTALPAQETEDAGEPEDYFAELLEEDVVVEEDVTSAPEPSESVQETPAEEQPPVEDGPADGEPRESAEVASEPGATPAEPKEELADVEGLFARLREPVSSEPSVARNGAEPSAEPADTPAPTRTLDADPFDVRDTLLLPITNRALRNVKRQLTEEQNAALERIRIDHTAWEPDAEALEASLKPDLVVLAAESFAAGHAAAESLTSEKLTRPTTPPQAIAGGVVAALTADLRRALEDGRTHDHGAREVAADISRVFRAWRTDESERRIRHFAYTSYNRGLVESVPDDSGVRWVVAGRGCAVCRDLGSRDVVDDPPPAHEGCACTVVPL
jgi:hypothetical protein